MQGVIWVFNFSKYALSDHITAIESLVGTGQKGTVYSFSCSADFTKTTEHEQNGTRSTNYI